ncbi:MAG: glyoxylase family protein [Frankiales bacterium]|jgi:glyoxylase I family protein|nr:glyoxylase family protein [Frankiales bacterium]MDX6207982.1 glyoxylase family protein [Frankiales bacterium]MDX6212304.1 glyoxylase family protein [Frankiales bacterium]
MQVKGITFVGTRTPARAAMSGFAREVLGLQPTTLPGLDADVFALPDGSSFAVTQPWEMDPAERTVGFLVDDVETAAAELTAAGIVTDEVAMAGNQRYVHFRAPDGQLYELVQNL